MIWEKLLTSLMVGIIASTIVILAMALINTMSTNITKRLIKEQVIEDCRR